MSGVAPTPRARAARRSRGFVLVIVIFFALLLFGAVATFLRRATVDAMIVRNRDAAARAEALARGGVRVAMALVLQDRYDEVTNDEPRLETLQDVWALAAELPLATEDGGTLRLHIRDSGALLNLNALFEEGAPRDDAVEPFLEAFFEKVIEEMPARPEEKLYDPGELGRNLIDWVDEDDVRVRGGDENAYYQEQQPPYRAANRPLLSVDELRLVEGFDPALVKALRFYVSVHPWAGGGGINPNTAPTWVLSALYIGTGGELRLADERAVRDVLRVRQKEELLCPENVDAADCRWDEAELDGSVFPPPAYESNVFHVTAEASYGEVRRSVEAVIDRSEVRPPRILAWRVR